MTEKLTYSYEPDFVGLPGDTILELLEERSMSQTELARRMDRPIKTINEIIHGKTALTPETALQLEKVLGTPAGVWNRLERHYREHLARQAEDEVFRAQQVWADNFPVREMQKLGWLPQNDNKGQWMLDLLHFFGVASPASWETMWADCLVNYRKSAAFASNDYALSAWLRQGELQAQDVACKPHNSAAFKEMLSKEIRSLTCDDPKDFVPRLTDWCAQTGVAVTFVPQVKGAKVSGAARWLSKEKAMIQLSLRYKTNDHLWFTFYHEAGHIVRHGKRDVFIDLEQAKDSQKEQEANQFAADMLVPPVDYQAFVQRDKPPISAAAVRQFAQEIGVAPGIVVGRLQHDGYLPFTHLNGLKVRFEWMQNIQE